jgi:hypothetical protein
MHNRWVHGMLTRSPKGAEVPLGTSNWKTSHLWACAIEVGGQVACWVHFGKEWVARHLGRRKRLRLDSYIKRTRHSAKSSKEGRRNSHSYKSVQGLYGCAKFLGWHSGDLETN